MGERGVLEGRDRALRGTFEEIVAAERDVNKGRMPERPFVLVGQQYLADPERSNGNIHPVWSYAHVPNGFDGNLTDAVIDQIERFAPGLRSESSHRCPHPAEFEATNANYAGGDIITGSNSPIQTLFGPGSPWTPTQQGFQACTSAPRRPPGAGVHGMNGFNAAQRALRHLERS